MNFAGVGMLTVDANIVAQTSEGVLIQSSAHKLTIADKSVHCIATSPPYLGLRRYHGEQDVVWVGGSYIPMTGTTAPIVIPGPTTQAELDACEHDFSQAFHPPGFRGSDTNPGALQHDGNKNRESLVGYQCAKCGALRSGFGSEEKVEHYVWHSLLILRELRRVLRDDGVLWWNLGDSYMSARSGSTGPGQTLSDGEDVSRGNGNRNAPQDMHGNLIGVPHRLMLAAQAAGWTVRNDCVWSKVSTMPESISGVRWEKHRIRSGNSERATSPAMASKSPNGAHSVLTQVAKSKREETMAAQDDKWSPCPGCEKCSATNGYILRKGSWRHTRSHEMVLMLTKGMDYWTDSESVKEPAIHSGDDRKRRAHKGIKSFPESDKQGVRDGESTYDLSTKNPRNVLYVEPSESGHEIRLLNWLQERHPDVLEELLDDSDAPRSILRPSPSNYTGQHYATFPVGLVQPLIKAATPTKCCPTCGKGWAPVIERDGKAPSSHHNSRFDTGKTGVNGQGRQQQGERGSARLSGYRQTCNCPPHEPCAGVVLDPFFGSGTTGVAARELGVRFIGADISREYLEGQAMDRALRVTPAKKIEELPLFAGKE